MSNLNSKFSELQADKKEQLPSLENMFTDMAIERQREAITNLKVFRDVTPEAGVSAIESSQEFGVPLPYTLRKQKEYEAERARKRQQEALINSTALSTFMADPQNAIMTSDSVAELAELERRLKDLAPGRGALAEITDVPRSVAAGAASLVGTGVRGIGETYRTAEEIQATLGIASGLEETYEAPGDNILMDVGGGVAELADIIRPEEQGFVDQVAEGLGQIAGAVGISFLPGGQAATMALFAGAGADQQAQRMRALGIDPASRPMDLAMGAGITGGSEALRLGSALRLLPRSVRNRLASGIMARIAGQAGEEAIQEAFENIAQNMVAQGYDPEARLFEGAIESATVAGTSAAVFQALVEATLPGRQKQLNAQNFQKNMSDLREAVEATPAYERKRETVEQFIRQATNGETVLLDDAGVVELMQSAEGLQTLRDMGLTDEQIQQALAGNDIEVEAAKILVVKNNFDEIVSITRTREGELTLVEAANEAFNEALQVDHDELIASLGDEDMALEGFENVERQVTQMMQEQNQPPEVAAKAGKLWGAFYKRLSEAGLDEQQIFEKLRLQMRGPEPRRQVGQLDIDLDDLRRGAIPSERAAYGSTLQSMARTAGLYDKEGFLKRGAKEDGPLDEFGGMALDKGFFQERPDLNELEAILTSGQPYYRPENRDERRAARRETLLDLENRLEERGLDLNTMTNDEIVKVLMAEETQAEPEVELFQVNIQDLEELEELIEWGKKQASKNKETKKPEDKQLKEYPAAIPPEYEFSNYKEIGGKFVEMTPDQFLGLSAELYIDQDSKENIDDIAEMMLSGRKIDPPRLSVMQDGKIDSHDGRHRALAAKRLGIKKIPVLLVGENGSAFPQKVKTLKSQLGAKDRAFATEIDEDGITYDQSGVINRDENFRRWFKDSKVVDEAGEPLVVYHGTRADIDAFQVSEGGTYGQGIYLTRDPDEASFYADPADETVGAVYPVYVNIKNPAPENIASEAEAEATASGVSSIDILKSQGYDGIDTGGEIVAFSPTQIKSVNNRGTFDPNDPRILFQAQQEGFEGTDRGEAEGWLNAKAKGLDMSQEARMERAREMGFDTERTLYHGTGSVFEEFELTGNDINNPLGPGIFMTAHPEGAAFFASDHNAGAQSNLMPLFIRGNIVDRATINLPFPALLSRRARAAFPDLDEADAVRAWFKDQGIDGLRTSNWEEVTVFDPANIRSVNAAFDPDYSDSGRILFQSGKAPSLRYAAVRVEGQVYTGKDHGEAAIKAEKAIGRPLRNINGEDGQSGFVGSDGKFYLRDEIDAALSALANDQITRDYMAKRIEKAIASGEKLPPLTSDMLTLFQQEGQGPRASVTFDPADILSDKDVLVRLTEAADKTSFLHESAHIFLEIYRSLDDGQNAFITQQMKDIREWLGAEEGKPFTTQQHETFAESFEVYLMEGKAPTRGMRAVFRTFKAWFTDVYRNLPLPKLNPKAREVFDAMLATDDEISAAQQEYTRNLSSTMSGLMDEELVAKYEDQARKAGELAREKLYRKFIDQINKRNSKEYKAARKEVEAQVRADVEARPPYRAFIALTTTDEQIDTKVIEQMRGKSAVAKIPRSKRGVHKKGGAHPDFVASKYGFTSGDAMLTALIGLRPIKETIAAEVEAELKRRFGDIENDGTAQREAIAAVFNEPSIKMMEAERDVLAQQAGKQPIPLDVFKAEAERRIRTMPIKDVIKPGRYAIKARDLHKRSIRSAANGKWDQALRETHQAMLQHELARRAFKAQDEVRRVKAYLKRSQRSMQKKGAEKRIAPEYREQILALLNLPGQPQQSEVLSQLQAFEKAQQADAKPVSLSNIDKPIPDLRDMSMDQLRDYRDNVKNLTKVGRDMSEEARLAKVKVAAELGDEVIKTWGSRDLKRLGGQRTVKTRGEKIRDWVLRKDAEVMRMPFIAEMWQGGKKGKLIDFFDIKLRMAMGQRNKHMADLDRQYVEILERHNITQSELHRVVSVPELTPVGDVKFEALLAVLLNMGSDGNVSRLLGDRMITIDKKEDLIALLEQHLEKRHFDAAQEIWALIDTLRAPAFEQERKLTGVTPKRVDPTALVTSHGTYAGGYYPLRYDPELNRDITEKNAGEMWAQRVAGVASKAQTKQGFLKEREANSERPLHLSLSVAMEHFQEATTDIYLREPITQIWDVLKREQFANAVESTFGGAYLKAMETMLKRTAAGTQPPTSDVEKLLRGARVNATVAILGNNVVTAVLAPISYTQTVLTRYSAITVGRGMVSYYGNVVKANKLINEKSSFMRERTQNINREAHERITKQPFSSAYSRFQGSGFWLMAGLEKLTVSGPLWMGVYEQSIMEGKSEAVAVAEADRAVSTTQGSGLEMDQSVLQGGNEMERLVTFMWGYVSSVYGNTRAELGQEGAKRKTLAMVKFIAMSVVISSAIEALLRNGFGDEEDPYVVNWLKMMWRNSIGVLPGAGTFFSRYDARPAAFSAGTSVVEAADAYYKTGETFFEDGELDGEQAGKALLRTFEALGFAAGVPGTVQLNKLERTLLKDDDPTIIEALITGPDDDN